MSTDTVSIAAGWLPDPTLPGRLRYWDGGQWSGHVSSNGETYEEQYLGEGQVRWQYGVVNIGTHFAGGRMTAVLGIAGESGWQLVSIYDKASNWTGGAEKGFMLLRRPVPPGVRLKDDEWCVHMNMAGSSAGRDHRGG